MRNSSARGARMLSLATTAPTPGSSSMPRGTFLCCAIGKGSQWRRPMSIDATGSIVRSRMCASRCRPREGRRFSPRVRSSASPSIISASRPASCSGSCRATLSIARPGRASRTGSIRIGSSSSAHRVAGSSSSKRRIPSPGGMLRSISASWCSCSNRRPARPKSSSASFETLGGLPPFILMWMISLPMRSCCKPYQISRRTLLRAAARTCSAAFL